MHRKILVLSVVLALLAGTIGWASGGPEPAAGAKEELVVWHTSGKGSTQEAWLQAVAKKVMAKNPQVEVITENQPGLEMTIIFQTAAAAHRGADLIMMWTGMTVFPYMDAIYDLRKLGITP
jgi:ABC-type glycerol-3-phosphate transport system substrate-binding protein